METPIEKLTYIRLAVQGDNATTPIEIDMASWAEEFPSATFSILFKPYNSIAATPVLTEYDAETKILKWTPTSGATAVVGVGYAEIRAQNADTGLIKKSRIIPTSVENSVSGNETEPPASYQDWVTAVLNAGENAVSGAAAVMAVAQGAEIKFEIDDNGHLIFFYTDEVPAEQEDTDNE